MDTITIRNADVNPRSANFTGIPKSVNDREGKRYFLIRLDEDLARELENDGWAVKWTQPRRDNPEYEPYPYIKVNINYDLRTKPKVYMVTKNNKTLLNEDTIGELEGCTFDKVDVNISKIYYRRFDQWSIVCNIGFFTIQPDEKSKLMEEYFGPGDMLDDDLDYIPFN